MPSTRGGPLKHKHKKWTKRSRPPAALKRLYCLLSEIERRFGRDPQSVRRTARLSQHQLSTTPGWFVYTAGSSDARVRRRSTLPECLVEEARRPITALVPPSTDDSERSNDFQTLGLLPPSHQSPSRVHSTVREAYQSSTSHRLENVRPAAANQKINVVTPYALAA
ncbi:hypothetical protein IWZ01DRAFT_495097 [Phyllosticta capitalensis]